MYNNTSFSAMMDAINTKQPYATIKNLFTHALDAMKGDVAARLRLKTAYYDYLNTLDSKKYKNELKDGLQSCYDDLNSLEKTNTITAIKDSLTFLVYGIDYRVTGSLSKGTKSIKIIDELFEKNSNDEGVMLLYAQRKAEAPKIGGGDTEVALSILNKLLDNIDNKANAVKFAVYNELANIYEKTDKSKASYYREKASDLY